MKSPRFEHTVARRPRWLACLVLVSGALGSGLGIAEARAEGVANTQNAQADDARQADVLFSAGKAAFSTGNYVSARAKFEASLALDASASTKLWVARCLDHEGKLNAAAAAYREALELNGQLKRNLANRERLQARIAQELATLEQRIPKITIRVSPNADGVQVSLDGAPLAKDALPNPIPVDPGPHAWLVTAPHYRDVSRSVVARESDAHEESFSLESAREAAAPPALPELAATPRTETAHALRPEALRPFPDSSQTRDRTEPSSQRVWGWSVGGLGAAALVASGYFAVHTLLLVHDADCDRNWLCSDGGLRTIHQAKTEQTRALVTGAVGVAALSVGVVLLASSPRPRGSASQTRLELGLSSSHIWAQSQW